MDKKIYIDLCDRPFERMIAVTVEDMGLERAYDAADPDISLMIGDNGSVFPVKGNVPILILDYAEPKNGEDHLLRPFDMDELCRRIWLAALSDDGNAPETLVLDEKRRRASYGKNSVSFTEAEFALLKLLYSRRGETVSDGEIACAVWGKAENDSNITAVYINYVRTKLMKICGYALIKRVRGVGYGMTELPDVRNY